MPVLGFCNASEKIHFKLISVSPNYTVYFIISFAKISAYEQKLR